MLNTLNGGKIHHVEYRSYAPPPYVAEFLEAEFLDEIQTRVLRVFLLTVHSHLYSFALRILFLQSHTTSYSFHSSVTVYGKGERRKLDRKPYALPYGLRNPYRNLKSENSQDYAQKPQRNCMFMNPDTSGHINAF
jgi:hypothetical protein